MTMTTVQFVLTVPAVWSDSAKHATLQAAEKAGMGNRHELKMISEPEAAALYTLKTVQPTSVRIGDNVRIEGCNTSRPRLTGCSSWFAMPVEALSI